MKKIITLPEFNMQKMEKIYRMKYGDFKQFLPYNSEEDYYFRDNKSQVLAVAHLDFVGENTHFVNCRMPHRHLVFSPVHDDRLGVYLILEYLPKLGITYDILLTNNEEQGRSTAAYFDSKKQYNWVFSFDRAEDEVVLYDYESVALEKHLESFGFKTGWGTYSDICELEHLECSGFNFGTHYYNNHTQDSYADLTKLKVNIERFHRFYKTYKKVYFQHEPYRNYYSGYGYTSRDKKQPWDKNDKSGKLDNLEYVCIECGAAVDIPKEYYYDFSYMADNELCWDCYSKYFE